MELIDETGLLASLTALTGTQKVEVLQYGATAGDTRYEQACRHWLADGPNLSLRQHLFVATSGAQQAIELVARAVIEPGDRVAVEAPTYPAATSCFLAAGAEIVEVPSDSQGLQVEFLSQLDKETPIKALYIVPTFGNPSGRCLSPTRRKQLAQLSTERRFYVVEDDPYAALGFDHKWHEPVASHASGYDANAVWSIYISSFSKVLGPGLRAGFALMPPDVAEAVLRLKQISDIHSGRWAQAAVGQYLEQGRMSRQLQRLRSLYANRCEQLCMALDHNLAPLGFRYTRPLGGMFVWGELPGVTSKLLLETCVQQGVVFVPGSSFFVNAEPSSALRLSFSAADGPALHEGVRRIAEAASRHLVH